MREKCANLLTNLSFYSFLYEKEMIIMRFFDYSKLKNLKFDLKIVNLLSSIHEAKGRQQLFLEQQPETLDRLVEMAKVQSTESSNAIEGIRTTDARLKQLLKEKTTPKNRNEEEISGYRDALNTIHESFEYIPLTVNYILQLHGIMYKPVKSSNFGGHFKNTQNYIESENEQGEKLIIFTLLAPYETQPAMENLCEEYNKALEEGEVDSLILIPVFIHDFLCIHPFRDGNGRMSRLLTTLLLYRSGYYVGKYISLEAKIAKIKDLYYDALCESQDGWYESNDDPTPFIKYILSIIDMAYKDFEDRVGLVGEKILAIEQVEIAFSKKIGKVKKSDIVELCPLLSVSAIEKGIAKMLADGKITKEGNGKNTFYIKK